MTHLGIASLVVLVPGALLALWALYRALGFLQKRLRLFTRGTVTFMTLSLVLFTFIDLLMLGNELKLRDQRVRRQGTEQFVSQVVRNVVEDPSAFSLGELGAEEYTNDVQRERTYLASEVRKRCGRDLEDFELILVRVDRRQLRSAVTAVIHSGAESWSFRAILSHPDTTLVVEGNAQVRTGPQKERELVHLGLDLMDEDEVSGARLEMDYGDRNAAFRRDGYRYRAPCRVFRRG